MIGPFQLAVGLGMLPRREAGGGPNGLIEGLPDLGRKLGSSVGDDVNRKSVKPENMVHQEVCHLQGRLEFGERDKVNNLRNVVYNGQEDSVPVGGGQTPNNVYLPRLQ